MIKLCRVLCSNLRIDIFSSELENVSTDHLGVDNAMVMMIMIMIKMDMILVASPTWISTIALRVSLSTILESLSSLPLRINNEYDDLVGGIDKFCTPKNILQFLLK